jgi:uncharacterized protein (TIGR02171 family)
MLLERTTAKSARLRAAALMTVCFVLSVLALFLVSCSDVYTDAAGNLLPDEFSSVGFGQDSLDKDMVRIYAKGAHATLGTDDSTVKVNERTKMRVEFDYDFSIGKHEVTCGEFNKFVGAKKSALKNRVACKSSKLPATEITYFDAVLFANAKSVSMGLDTAYTYLKAIYDDDGVCINLEGLVFRSETDGFRLPNEAEWALAAIQGWNPSESWNASNSKYRTHEVCGKKKNDLGLCDMAGNVVEWVNDWMGPLRDTTVNDFMGASERNGLGERVIKGGGYKNQKENINLYTRGDVYTVTSATKAAYVGMRLARGRIPSPEWLDASGKVAVSKTFLVANSSTLRKVVNMDKMKLVFRDDLTGHLNFIDYSKGVIGLTEIKDSLDAYHPDISPDGSKVAFCTGLEGVSGASSVYVRNLDAKGSNLVKLDVANASIPRWYVMPDGDTVIVYVTDSGNNKNESQWRSKSTWKVKFEKGKFGKPEKLFDGAYHGGVFTDGSFAVTGSQLLRVRASDKDSVWYNGEQACNVSLSRERSKKVLFLDFGSKTGKEFVGKKYGEHERLFVMNLDGQLVNSFAAPKGFSFDHTEWVLNYSNEVAKEIAVATLANANGMHSKVVLLNMADSSLTELVSGVELWHPSLWITSSMSKKNTATLDPDSAGVYLNSPDDPVSAVMLRYKMELLWRYRNAARVAIMGSSRPLYGVSPLFFDADHFAVNLSHSPNSIYAIRDYYLNYVDPHFYNLNYLIISLDIDFWNKKDDSFKDDNFFAGEYKRYPGYVYDKNHNYWKDNNPQSLYKFTKDAPVDDTLARRVFSAERGRYLANGCGKKGWGGKNPEIEQDTTMFDDNPELIDNSMAALDSIIRVAANRNVTVIGIIFPQSPAYKKTGAFGRYGMRRSLAKKVIQRIEDLTHTYSNFVFWDSNKMGDHKYGDKYATDYDHLCHEGTILFSVQVDSLVRAIEKKK